MTSSPLRECKNASVTRVVQSKKGAPVVSFRDWFTTVRSSSARPGRVSAAQPSSARPPLPLPAHEPCLQLHSSLPIVSYHGDDECHNFARDRLCCFHRQHNAVLEGVCGWMLSLSLQSIRTATTLPLCCWLFSQKAECSYVHVCLFFEKQNKTKTQMIRTLYQ